MATTLPTAMRKCRRCHKTFKSVNGAVTCLACMRTLAEAFWAEMEKETR